MIKKGVLKEGLTPSVVSGKKASIQTNGEPHCEDEEPRLLEEIEAAEKKLLKKTSSIKEN